MSEFGFPSELDVFKPENFQLEYSNLVPIIETDKNHCVSNIKFEYKKDVKHCPIELFLKNITMMDYKKFLNVSYFSSLLLSSPFKLELSEFKKNKNNDRNKNNDSKNYFYSVSTILSDQLLEVVKYLTIPNLKKLQHLGIIWKNKYFIFFHINNNYYYKEILEYQISNPDYVIWKNIIALVEIIKSKKLAEQSWMYKMYNCIIEFNLIYHLTEKPNYKIFQPLFNEKYIKLEDKKNISKLSDRDKLIYYFIMYNLEDLIKFLIN